DSQGSFSSQVKRPPTRCFNHEPNVVLAGGEHPTVRTVHFLGFHAQQSALPSKPFCSDGEVPLLSGAVPGVGQGSAGRIRNWPHSRCTTLTVSRKGPQD